MQNATGQQLIFNGTNIAMETPSTTDIVLITLTLEPSLTAVKVVVDFASPGVTQYFIAAYGRLVHMASVTLGAGGVVLPIERFIDRSGLTAIAYSAAAPGGAFYDWKTLNITGAVRPEGVVVTVQPTLDAAAWEPGNALTYTGPTYTGAAGTVTTTVLSHPYAGGSPVTLGSLPATLTAAHVDRQLEVTGTIAQLNGDPPVQFSTGKTPRITALPVVDTTPEALTSDDIEVLRSVYRPATGQQTKFAPVLSFPGLVGVSGITALEATTTPYANQADIPENNWEMVGVYDPAAVAAGGYVAINYGTVDWETEFTTFMRDPASRNPLASPKVDWMVFDAGESDRLGWLRFRYKIAGVWSYISAFKTVPLPPIVVVEPPPPGTGNPSSPHLLRPMASRQAFDKGVTPDFPALFSGGKYFGGGPQFGFSHWRQDDDCIIYGDMHGPRFSRDGGRTWNHMRARGHDAWGGSACARDPVDPQRFIIMGGRLWTGTLDGILSTSLDGGWSFPYRKVVANGQRDGFAWADRFKTNQICCWPVTGGDPATRTWRVTACATTTSPARNTDLKMLTSTNGGLSWSEAILAGMYGVRVNRLLQSPHSASTLYMAAQDRLAVSTNGGANWTSIATGIWFDVWEDPSVAGRLIACRQSDGVWYRPNASSGLVNILSRDRMTGMAVGPIWSGKRTIWAVRNEAAGNWSDRQYYMLDWTLSGAPSASGWYRSTHTVYDPNDATEHWRICVAGENVGIMPSQTDHLKVSFEGFGVPWRTDNGQHIVMSSTGFHGEYMQSINFDWTTPGWINFGISDVFNWRSHDYGLSFFRNGGNMGSFKPADTNSPSSNGCIRLTAGATYVGREIAYSGNNHGATRMLRRNAGVNDWTEVAGEAYRSFLMASRQNPNLIYAHNLRSTNAGDSFTGLSYAVVHMSITNGDHIVGSDGGGNYYISTNAGGSWTFWFGGTGIGPGVASFNACAGSPHDFNKFVARTGAHDIVLRNGGVSTTLNLRAAAAAAMADIGGLPGHWYVSGVAWSSTLPRTIMVCGNAPGGSCIFEGTLATDYLSCVWKDRTANYPSASPAPKLASHPTNGEFAIGGPAGVWWLRSSGEAMHQHTVWGGLPQPLDGALHPVPA